MVHKDRRYFGTLPEVEVQHPTMAQLEADVATALSSTGELDASDVEVAVADGAVTLTGWVSRSEEIGRSNEVVASVPGVRQVRNLLAVRTSSQAPE